MGVLIPLAACVTIAASLAAQAPSQSQLIQRREKKLASPFLKQAGWVTDFDAARAAAKASDKLIFGYFTRSFEPCPPCLELEGTEFLEDRFVEFGEGIVLFCHVTTQVEGDPHPGLLAEKGGSGWPYLAVLDFEGKVLARNEGDRTTAGFAAMVERATAMRAELAELQARADRSVEAAGQLLLRQVDLRHVDIATAKIELAALEGLDAELLAQIDGKLILAEVAAIQVGVTQDEQTQIAAGRKFAAMIADKRIPPDADALYFWYFTVAYAKSAGDVDLFARAVDGLRKQGKSFPASMVQKMETELAGLRARQGGDGGR